MTSNENPQERNTLSSMTIGNDGDYRESVRKLLQKTVGTALDEETRETTKKLTEERQKAVDILVEENKSAIRALVEEGKKIIRARVQAVPTSDAFHIDYIEEVVAYIYKMMGTPDNGTSMEMPELETPTNGTHSNGYMEIEILPPRDQDEIEAINAYLNSIPQVSTVEHITMVDKSIFRVKANEAIDFLGKLQSLPQVLEAKSVLEGDSEKIQITLQAKSKLVKSQEEMNAKVKKIFRGKN